VNAGTRKSQLHGKPVDVLRGDASPLGLRASQSVQYLGCAAVIAVLELDRSLTARRAHGRTSFSIIQTDLS
jgi:hypothetical protein